MKISFKKIWCLLCVVFSAVLGSANAAVTYVHTDHLGSVVAESNSAGQITKRLHYKPFGESIEAQQDDIGYAAHKFDTDLGLSYMEARYYDPVLGRFYGNDPVGYVSANPVMSFNRYMYVNNNPYRYTDPDGEIINFIGKFVLDVGVNVAIQVATGQDINLKDAVVDSAQGVLDPSKTLRNMAKLGKAVGKYEVGSYKNLKDRSVPNDGLDIHHAAQSHPSKQVIPGYDHNNAPAIALPSNKHKKIPTIKGEYTNSARDLLATDVRNLRNYTNTPNSSIKELVKLNKEMYPDAFARVRKE